MRTGCKHDLPHNHSRFEVKGLDNGPRINQRIVRVVTCN